MRKSYRCVILVEIQKPSLVPGEVDLAGTCQRLRNGRDQCPNFRDTLDLQSFIVLILGSGFTPLTRSLINALFITVALPACACTSGFTEFMILLLFSVQIVIAIVRLVVNEDTAVSIIPRAFGAPLQTDCTLWLLLVALDLEC